MFDKQSINYKNLILGVLLDILVIIVFILLYHAYVVSPQLRASQNNPLELEENID